MSNVDVMFLEKYVIVKTRSAGCYMGYIKDFNEVSECYVVESTSEGGTVIVHIPKKSIAEIRILTESEIIKNHITIEETKGKGKEGPIISHYYVDEDKGYLMQRNDGAKKHRIKAKRYFNKDCTQYILLFLLLAMLVFQIVNILK